MRPFPIPDKEASKEELTRDILYDKIPPDERDRICGTAWDYGVSAFENLKGRFPGKDIEHMAAACGASVCESKEERIAANTRYFGEYCTAGNKITVYVPAAEKWAKANGLSYGEARGLIIAHELFHHLEQSSIGPASELYKVKVLSIGGKPLLTSGVRALSEIAAHGFSHTYLKGRSG